MVMDESSIENIPVNNGDEEPVPIVRVHNAYKRYTQTAIVLQGLNMCVNKGSIYGLLGPSGCGKTTLLSCLVGRQVLDSGTITVGLDSKIQLGYMPQDISLYDGFNVKEIFMYFGLLLKKSKDYISARGNEFIDFLELPPSSRILSTLSGGQQRRVSMAVALLHDPELLILDEPTVGVDPLLSHKIWLYFLKITNEGKKTIIITTHYIEEAKNSHTIGLMRGGVILTEMCPTGLMTSLNCSSLEEAFLMLSKKQENHQLELSEYPKSNGKSSDTPFSKGKDFLFYRFMAQLHKNYWWTKRNIPITLFMLALPAALFIIFMWMLGGKLERVKIATVRDELIPGEDDCDNPKQVTSNYGCSTNVRLSCEFITYLRNQSYEVIEYKTLKEGIDAVKYNKTFALLHFPKNYTEALLERIGKGYKADNETIKTSFIDAHLDNTVYLISLVLGQNLLTAFYNAVGPVITRCGINRKVIDVPPIKKNPPVHKSSDIRYHALSGYVISVLCYLAYVYTSSAISYEKNTGVGERAAVSGITGFEVAAAHFCMQTTIGVFQIITMLLIVYGVFDLKTKGKVLPSAIICLFAEYIGMLLGFLATMVTTQDRILTYMGIYLIITLFFSIGMIWPVEGMHWILKTLNSHNPMAKATETYHTLQFRDLPYTDPMIYGGFMYLIGFFLFLSIVCAIKLRNY